MDAALYEPAPPYPRMGRSPRKGARLPTPQAYLDAAATAWTTVEVRWYDGQIREMELASATAVWFHYGKPVVPIRWVLVRDPLGEYETTCLLCTDETVAPRQIGMSQYAPQAQAPMAPIDVDPVSSPLAREHGKQRAHTVGQDVLP